MDDVPIPQPGEDELLCVFVQPASTLSITRYAVAHSLGSIERCCRFDSAAYLSGRPKALAPGKTSLTRRCRLIKARRIDRGSYAEYVLVRPDEAAPKPKRLSHIEAAAVPLAALTAWQGLFDHGHLEAGQTVLIHGGSGGVGHFAIQFAKVTGATAFTTVSAQNLDFVRELGADRAIDYQSQRFEEIARDVDLVLDLVGGETQERSWSVLKPGGILVSALGEPPRETAMQHRAHGVGYRARANGGQLAEIGRLIDQGKVRPVIMAAYPLAEAGHAHEQLERGHVRGKIVLVVTE